MLNSDTSKEIIITHPDAKKVLTEWFNILSGREARADGMKINGRAWRAELRRMSPPYGVMMCEGYAALRRKMMACMRLRPVDEMALALFTSVAIHIQTHANKQSFAAQLGAKNGNDPFMSALRFERLQQVTQPDEFCLQLVRAVKLRGSEGVNIVSLADSIFLWMREWQQRQEEQPEDANPFARNRIRWASEYLSSAR
jgi:CRISPR system Cascade subunit CasB